MVSRFRFALLPVLLAGMALGRFSVIGVMETRQAERAAKARAWIAMNSLLSANSCCCGTVVTVRLSAVTLASGKSNSRNRPSSSCRLIFA